MMVGKALYEGILLDLAFAPFFITGALQGQRPGLDDLATCDPQLHRSALMVKGCQDPGELEDLGLTFSTEQNVLGQVKGRG
jgi:ubiquitin-protein ligase E3 C